MKEFLSRSRSRFVYAGFFSLFVNLLMLALPLYMLQVFDRVLASRSTETLLLLTLVTLLALLSMMALDIVRGRMLLIAGVSLDETLAPEVVRNMLDVAATPGGARHAAGLRDVNLVRTFLTGNGVIAFFDAPWVPVFTAIIFLFHPLLGWLALCGVLILLALAVINERLTREPLETLADESRRSLRFMDAGLRNAESVHALGMGENITRRWQALNVGATAAQERAGARAAAMLAATKFFRLGIQVMMMGAGAWVVILQEATPGVMIAGTLILARALAPVEMGVATWRTFVDARGAYARLSALLARGAAQPETRVDLPRPAGRLEADKVLFTLGGPDKAVLKGVSFVLEPGKSLGVVGPNAAGKSTLARILAGVWKPSSGVVRLDGADVADQNATALGRHVGYLQQEVELFDGTVAENIARLGEADSEGVIAAARRAEAHDMILKLPNGYDTPVEPGGGALSAGQRQRIALARALYGDPALVIMDEPNANLDGEGEEALLRVMRTLADDGVTVVIISHKPSVVNHTQYMLVLRDGQVELLGPTSEVLGRIARMSGSVTPIQGGRA